MVCLVSKHGICLESLSKKTKKEEEEGQVEEESLSQILVPALPLVSCVTLSW